MKKTAAFILLAICACQPKQEGQGEQINNSIQGTWQLLSAQTITGSDTTFKDYTQGMKGIKMLNQDHFAFFQHDLTKGTDSTAYYGSGAGPYTYKDGVYKEVLEYCTARQWEGHTFEFELFVDGDTLLQVGREKVEALGVDRVIREKYVRLKP